MVRATGGVRGVGCVLAVAAVLAAQFGSATLAHGATVAVVKETLVDIDGEQRIAVVRIGAGPAEANDVTVATTREGVRVRDRGVPLIAGAGCVAAADGAVLCTSPRRPIAQLEAALGDASDTLVLAFHAPDDNGDLAGDWADYPQLRVYGGDGDDDLTLPNNAQQSAAVWAYGQAGDDSIVNGEWVYGGQGDDRLVHEPSAPQRHTPAVHFVGGPGNDVMQAGEGWQSIADYGGTAVRVDLADPGPDGHPGEADTLIGIDGASGGGGDDILIGDDGENSFWGGRGADVVRGGAGDDFIVGGAVRGRDGRDRLFGGPGDDKLLGSRDDRQSRGLRGTGDMLSCGDGRDTVTDPALLDLARADCETGLWTLDPQGNESRSLAAVGWRCNRWPSRVARSPSARQSGGGP